MASVSFSTSFLEDLPHKTVIVTGGANGIGAQTVLLMHRYGANVVIADLPSTRSASEAIITSLPAQDQDRMLFVAANTVVWADMTNLFARSIERFGGVQIVIANAGVMESKSFFDFDDLDEKGELREPTEAYRVIDVNLKGTMNTLKLALYHMKSNAPCFPDLSRGSIVLVSSTSGYFGGSGVASYISSKHGVVGAMRAAQGISKSLGIRVNGIAPFYTPTHITSGYSEQWSRSQLPANTLDNVAQAIAQAATDSTKAGKCFLVALGCMTELEDFYDAMVPQWLGEDLADTMKGAGQFIQDIGGYRLPPQRL